MQKRKRRRSDRAGRPAMRSPGRPPVAGREEQQRFWKAIARGLSSEDAAVSCGVSPPVGGRWFREGGGMPPISLAPRSARYLSLAEREEIAILRAQGAGVRDIARRLRRAPSTVSRELRRNAATRSGGLAYRASTAQWHSDRRAKRPKIAKLAANDRLRSYVQDRLAGNAQHDQARATLRAAWKLEAKEGMRKLDQYASWLQRDWPDAAASVREGLDEIFTVNRLGLPASLRTCLTTTNIIDSTHSGIRQRTRRVTNWKNGEMALRWSAVAFVETEKNYRRITGYEHLWMLKAHLDRDDDNIAEMQKVG